MCGICGIIDYNQNSNLNAGIIRRMSDMMAHRGPDDEGIYTDLGSHPYVGLGHRRLKIIDLSNAGNQPMSNEDKTIWIVFNGEIYNYKELRLELEKKGHRFKSMSDTETIIHLYEDYGVDCVKYLRGMFAFAIWDNKEKHLFLARDRLGKKPLLYYCKNGIFCFASEFRSMLASGLVKKEINFDAIHYYLMFGYIPAPLTIYKDISKLLPAHTLVLKDKNPVIKCYWQLDFTKKINISEKDAQDEILRFLEEAVKIRLYSDVPLGVFLSGGIDSSIVVALMSKNSSAQINTFSIGFEEADYNELAYARKVAKRLKTKHNEFIVKPEAIELLPQLIEHFGEPFADSSCLPTYYVSKLTRKYVAVALNGDGGDETFGGYERYSAVMLAQNYQQIPVFLRKFFGFVVVHLPTKEEPKNSIKRLKRFFSGAELSVLERYFYWLRVFHNDIKDRLLSSDLKKKFTIDIEKALDNSFGNTAGLGLVDMLLRIDTLTYLPEDLLVKVDITSMANSLETRSPFLDHKFVEFAASLPPDYKIRRGIKKFILKKSIEGLLPKENIYRKKMGFGVPISKWFRNEMKDYLRSNLLAQRCLGRGYFAPDTFKELVKTHIDGRADYGHQLWSLLVLELWHQRFID